MAKQLNMPDLNTDAADVDIDKLERIVMNFVNQITDREVRY